MNALSLTGVVRAHISCADHYDFMSVVDTYRLAVGSPLSLLTFFAAAKKVSAAPHRGNTNRPLTNQGKAKALRTRPKQAPRRQKNQVAAGALGAREFLKYIIVDSTTAIAEATAANKNTCA